MIYDDFEAGFRTGEVASAAGPPMPFYGRVRTLDGVRLLLRKPDAWHLCREGARLLAEAVAAREADIRWAPATPSTWMGGTWRNDRAHSDPIGGCDPLPARADR